MQQTGQQAEISLGFVEQMMFDAIRNATPEQQKELRTLAASQSSAEFTRTLQQRFSQHASYITEARVKNVLAYDRQHQEQITEPIPGVAKLALEEMTKQSKPKKRWFHFSASKPTKQPEQKPAQQSKQSTKQAQAKHLEKVNQSVNGQHVEFASLAKLEYGLQWCENLIHILAPRLLIVGFVLSMVDLLTRGSLLNSGFMIYTWAIIQAMAIDATLPNMWRLAFLRFDEHRWIAGGVLLIVAFALAAVVLAALSIQFLQQSTGTDLNATMARLGIDPNLLSYVRSVAVVALAAILSVLNRTKVTRVKPAKVNTPTTQVTQPPQGEQSQDEQASKQDELNTSQPRKLHAVNKPSAQLNTNQDDKRARIIHLLNRNIGVTEIAKQVDVSKGYVSQVKASETKRRSVNS